ncbi:hypothetical protein [Winogradskyella sp. PG-2]|uniref:hypothetical protein n=1 Tax=Winogradskyella sp. PG-2 TaxID=754409 RepID=UPI00045888EC|nr:hypothetical protein [Winogradskyella sp. PG-2]BAO74612.1 hypothetical protein WPG_0382 [Winogradskyella sp. PG-2]
MQSNKSNSIKHFIFKVLAVSITLCYVLGPAHMQLNIILHTISHNFKAPSFVLQHNEVQNYEFANQVNIDEMSSSYTLNHQHGFLDFLNTVFDGVSNKDNNQKSESTNLELKINKHIDNNKYVLRFNKIITKETPNYCTQNQFVIKGYLKDLYRPPQI